ncbi:MAG TPA: succinate dehydrogenase, cytochrome b556 subunit [Accumulibacter sp.]|uniref:succinate dehydrogenase, cytochrome b556 subunit n=1 Tax=Accumulibacter sp. TaxID=2053492 RepID=UPI0025ED6E12|nr:succinate dehydrogenase, cytochrome b556 subunit [Accumulibacter sp.]MCM8600008.1 succinate dehydrogenase, cytochrome b556 subunit [Accumulibacter sp.]MCM8664195.1 succinate dehydrogenase, cytochrome b556 subunit [Accumulibacter sp.]HNC53152.1 succinate dehydrogenase, cytochrome b556 subunit [Accumulibacter sp.]
MAEMAIKKKRPKNLDLPTIRLPLPGILSILHRVSGAGIFLLLPFLLWLFQGSLVSPETFASIRSVVAHPLAKIVLLGLLWFYMHHFCAGIRYLLLDLHKGVELDAARLSSKIVFAVSIVLTLIIGARVLW